MNYMTTRCLKEEASLPYPWVGAVSVHGGLFVYRSNINRTFFFDKLSASLNLTWLRIKISHSALKYYYILYKTDAEIHAGLFCLPLEGKFNMHFLCASFLLGI